MIDCKAYGDPLPTIQWDKNNIMNGFDRDRWDFYAILLCNFVIYISKNIYLFKKTSYEISFSTTMTDTHVYINIPKVLNA